MTISNNTHDIPDSEFQSSCSCGSGGCGSHQQEHFQPHDSDEAPGSFQLLQEGDKVLDLGSGTGADCINIGRIIGSSGKVIGIDNSMENIRSAQSYLDKSGLNNVEFRYGTIEDIPVTNEFADVIYADCVFNLQQDRQKVADEIYRVCDHNGYVCVSDFVIIHEIPDGLRKEAALLMGCIGGAEPVKTFMSYFQKTGFTQGGIVEVNKVRLPDEILARHLEPELIAAYNDIESDEGIFKVVLVVEKPESCSPDTCCCNPDKSAVTHS
ncbi:MAG: methyltransferase domain-containing protein [Bacteroidales bacterium]